jgi:hypothetical protein
MWNVAVFAVFAALRVPWCRKGTKRTSPQKSRLHRIFNIATSRKSRNHDILNIATLRELQRRDVAMSQRRENPKYTKNDHFSNADTFEAQHNVSLIIEHIS